MTLRKLGAIALIAGLGTISLFAQSTLDFGKGPAQFFMTKDELAAWRNVKSESEAQAFINLFWARRDPTPGTQRNEFREQFEARVDFADKKWSDKKVRGSMTDRGKLILALGTGAKIVRSGQTASNVPDMPGETESAANRDVAPPQERWIFEAAALPKYAGTKSIEFSFLDRFRTGQYTLDRASQNRLNELLSKAAQAVIVSPNLTAADLTAQTSGRKVVDVTVPAPVIQTPAAPVTTFKDEANRAAIATFKSATTNPYKNVFVTWSEGVTAAGEYFVPVQLYVNKAAGVTIDTPVVFIGQVEDATGNVVAVYEEPAKLTASKDDFYFDKSLVLPSGTYTAYFGLVGADGKPLGIAKTSMELKSIDKDAPSVGRLILSNNIYALPQAQQPTDPFAFGGMKVVPKGNRTFSRRDELDFFVELLNPGLGEDGKPRFQLGVDITDAKGNAKRSPLSEVDVIPIKGVAGHFFVGSGYPLESFAPGKYKIKLKLIDMVSKKNYSLEESFTVVE